MSDDEIVELMKYSSPYEIYIINSNSRLVCLKCPFEVMVKYDIGVLFQNEIVFVDKVKITNSTISVYIIKNQAYYYYHFDII